MSHGIRIHEQGGASVLKWEPITVGEPGPGEALIRQTAVGLNYIDVYHRSGLYPVPTLPTSIGLEAAGVVEAVGPNVTEVKEGDRVAYAGPPLGAYVERRTIPAEKLIVMPDSIDDKTAAGMMLQGMTAQYLIHRTYAVQAGQTVLVHAAAGGVGLILCQWLKHLGATVIGTVGSAEKAALARANGCAHTINYREEDFVARVQDLTEGQGVPVIYDSVGKDTFERGFDCLQTLGMLVLYGFSSGPVPTMDVGLLSKGSFFTTRPSLMNYTARRSDLVKTAQSLVEVVASGAVKIDVRQAFPLQEARAAHEALEARQTTGTTVLTVE